MLRIFLSGVLGLLSSTQRLPSEGKPQQALPALLELYRAQPGNARLCLQIGIAYTRLQQLDSAALYYRAALKIDPALTSARKNLATVLWFLNKKRESEREFLSVVKLLPKDPVPHLYLGLAEHERKQFSSAKSHFEKAGSLAMDNPEVLPIVVETLLATNDFSSPLFRSAVQNLEKAAFGSAGVETYLALAGAYDKFGQPEKAYAAYRKAIETDPAAPEAYTALAGFASAHRNNSFALEILDQGLHRLPGSPRLLLQQGIILALEGDAARAQASFLAAAQAEPGSALPLLALGISQLEQGRLAEAAASFREATNTQPGDYRAEYLYALALNRQGAPHSQVEAAIGRAIALNPADSKSRVLLAQNYLRTGRTEAATSELEKALRSDPQNQTALYELGTAYRRQGRDEAAQKLFQTLKELKAKSRDQESEVGQILKTLQ